jgi:hypothetical protein
LDWLAWMGSGTCFRRKSFPEWSIDKILGFGTSDQFII